MNLISKSATTIAMASEGNPVIALITVALFYLAFGAVEALIERLVFGEAFEHWLDPVFMVAWIAYGGVVVRFCAVLKVDQ